MTTLLLTLANLSPAMGNESTWGKGASLHQTRGGSWLDTIQNFSYRSNAGKLYLAKPNAENTPGQACHASTSSGDVVNIGKYNNEGQCCGPKMSGGPVLQFCINCDNSSNSCEDGTKESGFFSWPNRFVSVPPPFTELTP